MRTLIAVAAGVVLALSASFGTVKIATNSDPEPVTKPLYNYGTR